MHQFSRSVTSDSLRPHGLQHTRLPYPLPTPRALLRLMSIESVMPSNHLIFYRHLLLLLQSFPVSRSFPVSWLFASGGESVGASASASALPMNIQGWFLLGLTSLIFLLFKGLSRVFSSARVWKHQVLSAQPSLWSKSHIRTWLWEHLYMTMFE